MIQKKNKLFRDAFKARQKIDSAIVDKHFENLCKFAEDAYSKMGQNPFSVITPSGLITFNRGAVDFTFTFEKIKNKVKAAKKKR